MPNKLFSYLRNVIEKEKTLFLLTESVVLLLVWYEVLIHFTTLFSEIYSRLVATNPFAANAAFGLSIIVFVALFLISFFSVAELIYRTKVRIAVLKYQGGWILVDSLIGMTILVVGLLAIMGSYIQTTKISTFSDNTTQATYIAQQELDSLKKDMDKDTTTKPTVTESSRTNGIYTISRKVATVTAPFADLNIIPIKVTVSWDNPKGSSITVTTYYFYYDSTKP